MTYDEAKAEVFDKLVPKPGDLFIEWSQRELRVTGSHYHSHRKDWVCFVAFDGRNHKSGGSVQLSEWWRWLNLGILERLDEDSPRVLVDWRRI